MVSIDRICGNKVDLLDLACLQPVHVNMNAICRQANVSIQAVDHIWPWDRYVPSDRFPELPNSMFAVIIEDFGIS
jgi:hypothetical protein